MYSVISGLFGFKTPPSPVTVPAGEHPLTQLIKDKVNLSKTPEPLLWHLHNLLHRVGVAENHSVLQDIKERLSHQALPVLGLSHPQPAKQQARPAASNNTYVQAPTATIEETFKALEAWQGPLDGIELCLVDDNLMAFIVQKFPQLKTLRLEGFVSNKKWENFTDQGLQSIAQLKALESLTIDAWDNLLMVSYKGFTQMLAQAQFASGIKDLKISTFFLVDEAMPALAKYTQLRDLYICAAWISEAALTKLLQSPALKKSVADFTFFNSQEGALSDTTLSLLKEFSALEHVALAEGVLVKSWKISDPVLMAFLEAQKKLKTLDLRGPVIKDTLAEKIGQMAQLETLRLDDCSSVSSEKGWKSFLTEKSCLKHLDLGNAQQLDEANVALISQLPLSFLSIDNGGTWVSSKWMMNLCTGAVMQQTLQTLRLTGLNALSTDSYEYLQNLQNLSSLRLNQSHWFNADALEFLSKTSLAKTLKTLELIETGLDDRCIELFAKFEQLQHLLLGSCYAITKEGRHKLLNTPELQAKLNLLAVDGFELNVDEWKAVSQFDQLKYLIISNDNTLQIVNTSELYAIAKAKGFVISMSWGITDYIQDFEKEVERLSQG